MFLRCNSKWNQFCPQELEWFISRRPTQFHCCYYFLKLTLLVFWKVWRYFVVLQLWIHYLRQWWHRWAANCYCHNKRQVELFRHLCFKWHWKWCCKGHVLDAWGHRLVLMASRRSTKYRWLTWAMDDSQCGPTTWLAVLLTFLLKLFSQSIYSIDFCLQN